MADPYRIEKALVIREVTAAGFLRVAEGKFLHRAGDDLAVPIFGKQVRGPKDPYALAIQGTSLSATAAIGACRHPAQPDAFDLRPPVIAEPGVAEASACSRLIIGLSTGRATRAAAWIQIRK